MKHALLLEAFKTKDPPMLTMEDMRDCVNEIDEVSNHLESDRKIVEVSFF